MARLTIVVGILLIVLGVGFYAGLMAAEDSAPSVTALIPAFFGLPILLCGLLALKESLRMHAMHGVALLHAAGNPVAAGPTGHAISPWQRRADHDAVVLAVDGNPVWLLVDQLYPVLRRGPPPSSRQRQLMPVRVSH